VMRIVVAVHLVLALAVVLRRPRGTRSARLAADSSGTLTGVLTGRDDGQPVPYGTVLSWRQERSASPTRAARFA